ncbi:MAG: heme ABC exporter ATP-binding protein CcmA [Deltaproteobacteria bacterium]|nr:heme ABC exporter ATP-binding protein CcmA [Deltaproteobacteria bacterium]
MAIHSSSTQAPNGSITGSPLDPVLFSLRGVGKRFGHRQVLKNLSFQVGRGEFLLLLGNNGAGKSTLMKMLSSLMRPSQGEVCFQGVPFHVAGPRVRSAIGMISHDSRLYNDLTARENLKLFGALYGVKDLSARMDEALARVRLDNVPDIPVNGFSSGMMKRLSLARLLLYNPQILLLDEPYSGLDQASIHLLDDYLEGFTRRGGTTVLITHQFTKGVALCNRILILHQGALSYNQRETGVNAARCAELLVRYAGETP